MVRKEKIKISIDLSPTYWDKKPQYEIYIDNISLSKGILEEKTSFEFVTDITFGELHLLKIGLRNKHWSDTIQSEDKKQIVKDMLINIDKIKINDVDIGSLQWTSSRFVLDNPLSSADGSQIKELHGCVNLGFNGFYILEFESPIYLWFIEHL